MLADDNRAQRICIDKSHMNSDLSVLIDDTWPRIGYVFGLGAHMK